MTDADLLAELPPQLVESVHRPSAARVYDYLIGGGHHFAVDREFAEAKLKRIIPNIADYAIANRQFLGRAVRHAVRSGYRQFVDIGSGLPSGGNVHEIADREAPGECSVVYVDNEPIAHAYGQLILERKGDPARHRALQGDLLDYRRLWRQVQDTGVIDLDRPVVLLIVAVLHFVKDTAGPDAALAFYRDELPPGSALVLSSMTNEDPANEHEAEALSKLVAFYEETTNPGQLRTRAEFSRFFGDFELVEPGLVYAPAWHPAYSAAVLFGDDPSASRILAGMARKPG
jgi:O-methyltransferase involved in polyketide biosynthesis